MHDESIAIGKIREDSNYFFRYAKQFLITRQGIDSLCTGDGILSDDRNIICKLFLDQFSSVFSIPDPNRVVSDPALFFSIDGAELLVQLVLNSPHFL